MKFPLIETFKKSVYSPDFYKELESKPFSFSLKYFFKLALVFVVISTVFISFTFIPKVNFFINKLGPEFLASLPDTIEVKIENGQATSNLEEPFYVPMPASLNLNSEESAEKAPQNLIVINTQENFELGKFDDYNSAFLLAKDVLALDDGEKVQLMKLSDFGTHTIDKPLLVSLFNKIPTFLKWLYPIAVIVIFIGLFAVFLVNLFYAFVVACLVFLFAKIKKQPIPAKKAYQFSIHVISLAILINFLGFIFFPGLESSALLFILLSAVVAWVNIFKETKAASVSS